MKNFSKIILLTIIFFIKLIIYIHSFNLIKRYYINLRLNVIIILLFLI